MTKIHFPQFSREDVTPFDMRQLVQALELRFQVLENASFQIFDTTGGIGSEGEFAPIGHTHVEADITDLQHTASIFSLDDVTGTPNLADTLVWNGVAFEPSTPGSLSLSLNDLSNVAVPAPDDQDVLTWNQSSGQWIALPVSAGGGGSDTLFDLTDTDLVGQLSGDILFNETGTNWGPSGYTFQWRPGETQLRLGNNYSINWLDDPETSSIELLKFSSTPETFIVGDTAYPTHIDGTKVELENNIGINWDDGAGTDVEHLVFANSFTAGAPEPDPNIGDVILLVTMEGQTATRPTSFAPDIGSAGTITYFTKVGAGDFAEISSTQSIFGDQSLYINGATGATAGCYMYSDMVTDTDWHFGTDDFTMEAHIYRQDVQFNSFPILGNNNFSSQRVFVWEINADGRMDGLISTTGNNLNGFSQAGSIGQIPLQTWVHVVFQRFGSQLQGFVNGVRIADANIGAAASLFQPTVSSYRTRVMIGGNDGDVGDSEYYLDNIRVTRGVARYQTASFTPPTAPYDGSPGELAFIVGDPAYPTKIDGTITTITGDAVVNGATQLDTTLNVDGIADFNATTKINTGNSLEIWNELDNRSGTIRMNSSNFFVEADATGQQILFGNWDTVALRDNALFRIYDVTNGDYAQFDHDGTDFNTNFNATTNWNIQNPVNLAFNTNGLTFFGGTASIAHNGTDWVFTNATGSTVFNIGAAGALSVRQGADIDLRDGGSVFIRDAGDTDWLEMSHDGAGFTFDYTNTANVQNLGATGWVFNRQANAGSILTIGESTTLRGGSQQAELRMYAETVGVIYSSQIETSAQALRLQGGAVNPVSSIELELPTNIPGGNAFTIFDGTNADSAAFSHDGTDFNAVFTGTTDWNITGANLVVGGDLTVSGTTTTINSNVVSIADNIILLNSDATNPPSENAGLEIERGGVVSNVFFLWNETNDSWEFINASAETIGDFRGTGTARQLLMPQINAEATPTIAFGDADTGFFEGGDDQLQVSIGGTYRFLWAGNSFQAADANGGQLLNEAATVNNPTLIPNRANNNSGIGGTSGTVSIITDSVQQAEFLTSGNHSINSLLDEATGDEIALDINYTVNKLTSGADTGLRLNVTETSSPGTSLFAEFVAGGVTKFSWSTNPTFTMYDNTGANSTAFQQDGANFYTTATGGSRWFIEGFNNGIEVTDPFQIRNGNILSTYNGDNTAATTLRSNVLGATGTFVGGTFEVRDYANWDFVGGQLIRVRDGGNFRIYDALDTDYANFSHDGTDFNTTFTGTAAWNILSNRVQFGSADITGAIYMWDSFADKTGRISYGSPVTGGWHIHSGDYGAVGASNNTNWSAKFTATSQSFQIMGGGNFTIVNTPTPGVSAQEDKFTVSSGTSSVQINDGWALRIYDALDTDYAEFSHDGTNFNTTFTGTTNWNISDANLNITGNTVFTGNTQHNGSFDIRGSSVLYLYNATNTLRTQLRQENTFATIASNDPSLRLRFSNYDTVDINDGINFRIYDSTNIDFADFSHDGTDFNTDFTNTTDWNITNVSAMRLIASALGGGPQFYCYSTSPTTQGIRISHTQAGGNRAQIISLGTVAELTGEDWYFSSSGGGSFFFANSTASTENVIEYNSELQGFTSIGRAGGAVPYYFDFRMEEVVATTGERKFRFRDGSLVKMDLDVDTNILRTLNGVALEMRDSSNADIAKFSHDGTDFNTAFTTTTDWNITGLSGVILPDVNIEGLNANGPAFINEAAAATNPTLAPDKSDKDTGIGTSGADALSLIAGAHEALRFTEVADDVLMQVSANVGLTADVGSAQGNGVITSSYNVYSTVANAGDAATLPSTFGVSTIVYVKNDGANSMDVFPASGDDAGAGTDTAVAVAAGDFAVFFGTVANSTWTKVMGGTA